MTTPHKVKYPICGLCENFRWITLAPQHGECVVIPGQRSPQDTPCDKYRCGYNEATIKSYLEIGRQLADIDQSPKNNFPISSDIDPNTEKNTQIYYDTPRL